MTTFLWIVFLVYALSGVFVALLAMLEYSINRLTHFEMRVAAMFALTPIFNTIICVVILGYFISDQINALRKL
jgi:hypothetical protein